LDERGIDGVIDVRAALGLEADASGRALDGADGIEGIGEWGDAHDVRDAGAFPASEGDCRGNAFFTPRIVLQRCGETEVEIGGDILDAEHAAMPSAPRGVMASAVGVPQHGGCEVRGILQREPDEFFLRKNNGCPREIIRIFVVDHDKVLEAFAGREAGEISLPSVRHRNAVEPAEPCTLLERGVAALGGVFKWGREHLREPEFAGGNAARAIAVEVEHGVVSEAHPALETFEKVGLIKVGLAGPGLDDLGDFPGPDACLQRGDQASGICGMRFPCGIGGLAVGRMRLAPPRGSVAKWCAEEIAPQLAEQWYEFFRICFAAPGRGGEGFHGLASDAEFYLAEMTAGGGDVEGDFDGEWWDYSDKRFFCVRRVPSR